MKIAQLTPAYGRDYASGKEVISAFNSNKDFIINNVDDPYCGKPVSRDQLEASDYTDVQLRYREQRNVVVVNLNEDKST